MGKTVAKVIAYVLVALLLAGTVGLIYKFTNGFNEDFKTFYVEYGGKQILTSDSKMTFGNGQTYVFGVKYTFDKEDAEPKEYSVKIVPHYVRDFDYTVDGERYRYSKVSDLTSCFALTKGATQFQLDMPEEVTLQKVLSKLHVGKTVVVPADAEKDNPMPYRLVISSYNEKVTYNIDFNVSSLNVSGVALSNTELIFGSGAGETANTPFKQLYRIGYDTLGNGSVLSIKFDCVGTAAAGETVTFKVTLVDLSDEFDDYYPLDITHIVLESAETGEDDVDLGAGEGTFTFTMPAHDVTVMFYLMRA